MLNSSRTKESLCSIILSASWSNITNQALPVASLAMTFNIYPYKYTYSKSYVYVDIVAIKMIKRLTPTTYLNLGYSTFWLQALHSLGYSIFFLQYRALDVDYWQYLRILLGCRLLTALIVVANILNVDRICFQTSWLWEQGIDVFFKALSWHYLWSIDYKCI